MIRSPAFVVSVALLIAAALPVGPALAGEQTPPDLSGRWAQKIVMTSVAEVPVVGRVTSRTISLLRVDIDQDGRDLTLDTSTCDVDVSSDVTSVRPEVPRAFVETIPDERREGRVMPTDDGWSIDIGKSLSVIGASLRAPATETLPTAPDDPRVTDPDDDAHPGVTIRVEGLIDGELYIVQRAHDAYTGQVVESGRIRGRVTWNTKQVVLDSNSIFLGDGPDNRPHPDADKSHFNLVRASEQTDCEEIISRRDRLFD